MPAVEFAERLRSYEPPADYPDPEARKQEIAFAEKLAHRGAVPEDRILECFELQNLSLTFGVVPPPPLRELLEAHGYPPETLDADSGAPPIPDIVAQASLDPRNRCGKFVRVRLLGRGGMGEVWKAWDTRLRRWVALKFVKHRDPEELTLFRREAQIAAALVHPNIAQVYEIVEEADRVFLVLQLVEGETLEEGIERRRFGPRAVARILRDAALAADFAHQRGVIHRDLKPANLMVQTGPSEAMRVYIMDFGLARRLEIDRTGTASGVTVGTPAYMPPEQAAGELSRVDARSDVYALGATLYHAAVGRPPYGGRTPLDTVLRVIRGDLVPPSGRADIPPDLERVILKAMDAAPERRYAGGREMAADLQRFLDGEPVLARPPAWPVRLLRAVRRRPVTASAVLFSLAFAALAGASFTYARREKAARLRAEARLEERRAFDERRRRIAPRIDAARQRIDQARRLMYESEDPRQGAPALAQQAIDEIEAVLREDPTNPRAWLEAGRAHALLGRDHRGEAESRFTKAIEHDPLFAPARFERGILRLRWYEDLRPLLELHVVDGRPRRVPRGTDPPEAAECKRRALADFAAMGGLEVAETDRLFAQGFALVLDEKFEEAEPVLADAIARFDLNADAWEYRGLCRLARGDMAVAVEHLSRSIRIRSRWPIALSYRALASLCLGKPEDALVDYREAIRLEPGNPLHLIRRSVAYRKLRLYDKALEDLDGALRLQPKNGDAWCARGNVHYEMQKFEAAVEDFSRAIEACNDAKSYVGRALAHAARRDFDAALADLNRAVDRDDRSWYAHFVRGRILLETRRLDAALEDFDWALRLNPDGAESRFWRAKIRLQREEFPQAREDLEVFLKEAPDHPLAGEAAEMLRKIQ